MLHAKLKEQYLRNEHKIIIPEDRNEDNMLYAASVAADFAANGFPLDRETSKALGRASRDEIVSFYKEYVPILEDLIGSGHPYKPFYPGFPDEVMEMDRLDIFLDQVLYGLSGFEIKPELIEEVQKQFPFVGKGFEHIISRGSEEDYRRSMTMMMSSAVAYTHAQREAVSDFFHYDMQPMSALPDQETLKNHENRVVLACIMEDENHAGDLAEVLPSSADVLRYAAVRSAERDLKKGSKQLSRAALIAGVNGLDSREVRDALYQYADLRFTKNDSPSLALPRQQRRIVMELLEKSSAGRVEKLAAELCSHKSEWKRFIKNIHIGDYPHCYTAAEAFRLISINDKTINPRRGVEEAVKQNDLSSALDELKHSPGEFIRRFDKLVRTAGEDSGRIEMVLDALRDAASSAGIAPLYSLDSAMKARTEVETERVFRTPSTNVITRTTDKNREPIPQEIYSRIHQILMEALQSRYAGKEPMGKVYISSGMKNYTITSDMRDTGAAVETFGRGSRIDLHSEKPIKRVFVHWTNLKNNPGKGYAGARVDLDLACTFYDSEGKKSLFIGWDAYYHQGPEGGFVFSGDVQDGGPFDGDGAAEFVDLDVQTLREKGWRYAVFSVSSYCGQTFDQQTNTKFGVMERDPSEMGKTFEPKAVTVEYKLMARTECVCPVILDLEEDVMVWVDIPYRGRVATMDQNEIQAIMRLAARGTENLYDIAEVNAKANGTITSNLLEADTLVLLPEEMKSLKAENPDHDFSKARIVYPYDVTYITGYLMPEGKKEERIRNETHV